MSPLASKSHVSNFRVSATLVLTVVLMMSTSPTPSAFAQGASGGGATGGAAGTNSAGTANASGGRLGTGATVGGPGPANINGAPQTGDAAVDAQDKAVDRKVKSICKGC